MLHGKKCNENIQLPQFWEKVPEGLFRVIGIAVAANRPMG
jgi:hypothetical protein